ncbi:hypothetical protein HYPSUDRAFT_53571 [Hypholoma sublateritium FD-334 SS-4]|uniref:Uncharacterized protein n=1 Tax=Hypholoma sublateritium (strain FD-334 SS-4) TaxID=945553 RepID=A0A0D2P1K8_HYPSF|nr:hypothetical protein HYPSUDRAFT_53571 [Hypholoma sublateritium FD-334 SS-4]
MPQSDTSPSKTTQAGTKRKRVLPASWSTSEPTPASAETAPRRSERVTSVLMPGLRLVTSPSSHLVTAHGEWITANKERTECIPVPADVRGSATDVSYLLRGYDDVKVTLSVKTDPPENRNFPPPRQPREGETLIPGWRKWQDIDEETKFFLQAEIEMPATAGFHRIFATSPTATLATFQGARVAVEAPDWIQLAWRIRPFWQPRTLMVEIMSAAARLEGDPTLRNELYDWTRCVSRVTLDAVHPPYPVGRARPAYLRHTESTDGSYREPDERRSHLLRVNYNQITRQKRVTGSRWV